MADQSEKEGSPDKAMFILSRATALDPDYYAPYKELGRLYAVKGNRELALEMFKKALEVFDRENDLPSGAVQQYERDNIKNEMDLLQKATK